MKIFINLAAFGLLLLLAASCQQESLLQLSDELPAELEAEEKATNDRGPGLATLLDADYDAANDFYVVSGLAEDGSLDTYYGTTRNWTKQRDDRDVSQIKGDYLATAFADDGTFLNFSLFQGKVNSNGGQTFYNAPRSNSGGAKVGDLVELIDADYDIANGYYVVSGKNAAGDVDTYYGHTRNWTKQRDDRDASQIKGEYLATAFAEDGSFLNFSIFQRKLTSNGGYTFYNAPRSNGGGAKVGDLVELLSADYDVANGYYVVSGKTAAGEVNTYYGRTRNWTKQRDDRDVSQIKGDYLTSALGNDGTFLNFSMFQKFVNSNGGQTFYNAPRSNSGGAKVW